MRSSGIVVEYNPFHNGHLYHLKETKKLTRSEIMIAVMSGHFLQRGEPALVSKWARTKMALQSGADIVVELPYAFAVQKAERFALGAIHILHALKCKSVCFGSEAGEIAPFHHTYRLIHDHQDRYNRFVREFVKEGMSYPSALSAAYQKLNSNVQTVDLSKPNNILGYHYVASAIDLNCDLEMFTIKRKSADYHDESFTHDSIASATSIRNSLENKDDLEMVRPYMPEGSLSELMNYRSDFGQFHRWEHYWPFLQYRLLTMEAEELQLIYEMEEGLEFRLKKAAYETNSFLSFMERVKTKRYTWTRLQRLCVHVLTNTSKRAIEKHGSTPQYVRLLGMSADGKLYLNQIKKELQLPIVSKVSAFSSEMIGLDVKSTNVYAQILPEPLRSKLRLMEYRQPPIFFN